MAIAVLPTTVRQRASRVVEVTLIVLGLASVVMPTVDLRVLVSWDLVAALYLVIRWQRVRRSKHLQPEESADAPGWLSSLMSRRTGFAFTLLTSLVGITAGLNIVVTGGLTSDASQQLLNKAVGVPAVVAAWMILHFGYAERYAHRFYDSPGARQLVFPEVERPGMLEFAHLSFTIGTSFAVSDVEVRSTGMRSLVLGQSVLSFFYNTAILGIAIGVISGSVN
ncbi:DUF1345 domain-containing protein [Umezawaea sp. Da 62-37]|uniref:DUF1345 domain-containing protein n=1 Tax=Umezawaea sp. Da 62-37 TaxID=3075927 RepID=UPI0028F6D7F5|nr:DUF1345 domain-containing protein [Umezawaea sp. Da 62-37]WNV86254.1 DUF1345 domain-containing protein [Umezawaea sp. Da 62-37]